MIYIIDAVNTAARLVLSVFFLESFCRRRVGRTEIFLFISIAFSVYELTSVRFDSEILLFITGIIIVFSIAMAFEISSLKRLLITAVIWTVFIVSDILAVIGLELVTKFEIAFLWEDVKYSALYIAASVMIAFSFFAVIRQCGSHCVRANRFAGLAVVIYPISSVATLFVCFAYLDTQRDARGMILTYSAVILLILSDALIFYLIDKQSETAWLREQLSSGSKLLEHEKVQYKKLFDGQSEIRRLRHDMKNYMLGIASLLENGETEKAKAVINSGISELSDNEKSFDATGNALIDTVIAVKIKEASDFGIKTETKLEIDSEINIEPVDFSMLIGNAFDNAIEAASRCRENKRNIFLYVSTRNENILIKISNSVNSPVNTEALKTNKPDKKSHGFGIMSMRKIAEKYSGEIMFEYENLVFTVMILMNNLNE